MNLLSDRDLQIADTTPQQIEEGVASALRDLERSPGFRIFCYAIVDKVNSARAGLESLDITPETVGQASRLQGRIAALEQLLPGDGDIENRSDLIALLIEDAEEKVKARRDSNQRQ